MNYDKAGEKRETVFISKATPCDDEFVLWLAPRLEAAGYLVLRTFSVWNRVTVGERR